MGMVSEDSTRTIRNVRLQLARYEAPSTAFAEFAFTSMEPKTPGEWFSVKFPEQAGEYGSPFLEEVAKDSAGNHCIRPLDYNVDFFASILGGDKRLAHQVIFYDLEQQWYFYDPRQECFIVTSEAKLQALMSQLFIRCASEMTGAVDLQPLFTVFRDENHLKAIVKRARALLAADEMFFDVDSPHKRKNGPEQFEKLARIFIHEAIQPDPAEVLPLVDCYLGFCEYCQRMEMEPPRKHDFKVMMRDMVREEFKLSLRNNIKDGIYRSRRGWAGLKLFRSDQDTASALRN